MIAALNFSPFPLYLAERSQPHRKRVPLVVSEEQRVLHANASARRHGVVPGMRLEGARMRVSNLEVVEFTEPDLQHAWSVILQELNEYTPWLEASGRGRVFAKVNPTEAQELARHYDVPVGVADDLQTAELAAVAARPSNPREVSSLEASAFVARLPLHFLKGVGLSGANFTRLQWLGVASAGDLARWGAPQIRAYLGEEGGALLPYLHGPRRTNLRPHHQPETVRRSLTFTEPVLEPHEVIGALDRLSAELEKALDGRVAQRLTLTATTPGGKQRASRLAKRPLQQARHIRQQALFALEDSRAQGRPIESLTLELAAPTRIGRQQSLWPQRQRRQQALRATLERYPASQRRLVWRDPYAQAADLAWSWEGYVDQDGAYANADVAQRGNAVKPSSKGASARNPTATSTPPTVTAAAVPLFDPESLAGSHPRQPGQVQHPSERGRQPNGAVAEGILFGGL